MMDPARSGSAVADARPRRQADLTPAQLHQNCANQRQFPMRRAVQHPIPVNRAAIRNSLFPSGPVMGLSPTPSTSHPGNPAHHAATRSQTARCTAGSRTTPFAPTAPGPASNCGLISATAQAFGVQRARHAGRTVARPMKLASRHPQGGQKAGRERQAAAGVVSQISERVDAEKSA